MNMNNWFVYIIKNNKASYVGVTPNPEKRILKHNGIISGGAKYTKSKGSGWEYICTIEGLDKINAMRFEWAVKHCPPKKNVGIENRMIKLYNILLREKWTKLSPEADTIPLIINWHNLKYRNKNINLPFYVFEEYLKNNNNNY